MTDKVQKIREELARLKEETSIGLSEHENGVEQGRMEIINALSIFLDSMQEDSKAKCKGCNNVKGCITCVDGSEYAHIEECNITGIKSKEATGKLKELVDNITEEGLVEARKQLEELTKGCMYSKDNYTDEDRKVLCDGCEEECEFKPTTSVWHDASEEPNDKSSCLIYYMVGGEVSYRDIFPVLYNKEAREFISEPYPHPTGYKVEQSSLEGGVVAEVYKNMRDRFPLSDIYKWAYIDDLIKL